jgi:hypothetical protein
MENDVSIRRQTAAILFGILFTLLPDNDHRTSFCVELLPDGSKQMNVGGNEYCSW